MTNIMNEKIKNRLYYDYNLLKNQFEVLGVFLQGSQNYELEYENSDIDTKAIIIPNFEDICLNEKPSNFTFQEKDGSHCDVKDIREMFKIFKKQNVNYLEILFTKYKLINPLYENIFNQLLENNEKIAHYNKVLTVKSIAGMSLDKLKALEHPYPIWEEHIKKYGYSNKQLHHIIRLNEFIKRYISGENFADCLISKNKKYLIDIKANPCYYKLKEAREIANFTHNETWDIKDEYVKNYNGHELRDIEKLLANVLTEIIKIYVKESI